MSTFSGIVQEFPRIQIDNFRLYENHQPPLACFLSHVHSDHLTGLDAIHSPFVYCTAATREMLLKLEKYPHRMNFAKGILEARKQTYRKVKRLLKPIPLETPTVIELTNGYSIQVTFFDANHCTGACMFLIEGDGKAILYTGDVRSEPWWVNSLTRNPIMIPYAKGQKRLDSIYLDTTFAMDDALRIDFPTKADGLAELLEKVAIYPPETLFYLDAWTFGYEDVWIALSKALNTQVHLCDYRYRVYSAMKDVPACFSPHNSALLGFQLGNSYHAGFLTKDPSRARIHSCERGTHCEVFNNSNVVRITPIITRHEGADVAEMGAGGGQGDLDQNHELELNDVVAVSQLISMCGEQLKAQPTLHAEIIEWLTTLMSSGRSAVKLDFEGFWDTLRGGREDEGDALDDIPLDHLVPALAKLVIGKPKDVEPETTHARRITFPFSRHASYNELRGLVEAFRPKDIYPCTVDASSWSEEMSMKRLFGDICSEDVFAHDQRMLAARQSKIVDEDLADPQDEQTAEALPIVPLATKTTIPSAPPELELPKAKDLQEVFAAEISTSSVGANMQRPAKSARLVQDHTTTATPNAKNRVSKHAATHALTLGSVSRSRARNRAKIAEAIQSGGSWKGLRSVSGYHNQEPELEL